METERATTRGLASTPTLFGEYRQPQVAYLAILRLHPEHPEVIKRLKRAQGHLKSIVTMLEEGRCCLDIAQQLQAVEKAVSSAKKTLVHDHIDHCLESVVRGGAHNADDTIREFKEITKYL